MELLENEYHLIGPNAISMNQATCTKGRRDCALSSPVKTPKLRRKRDDNGDDCDCKTTTDEELEPTNKSRRVWINKSKRNTRRQHEKHEENVAAREVPECSCNMTDEDVEEDECVCEEQVQRNARYNNNTRVQEREDVQENDHKRVNEERQTRPVQDFSIESSRRRKNVQGRNRTMEIVDRTTIGNNRSNKALSDNVDNFYSKLQGKILSSGDKKRERELNAWIKRCQEECKRQENRRNRNN